MMDAVRILSGGLAVHRLPKRRACGPLMAAGASTNPPAGGAVGPRD